MIIETQYAKMQVLVFYVIGTTNATKFESNFLFSNAIATIATKLQVQVWKIDPTLVIRSTIASYSFYSTETSCQHNLLSRQLNFCNNKITILSTYAKKAYLLFKNIFT